MQEYVPVQEFPNYGVRIDGDVINLNTGMRLNHHRSRNGHVYVSFSNCGVIYPRLVGRVVGHEYVPRIADYFNTIIHHDYDFTNCHASNLSWRSRQFAVKYHRQKHPAFSRSRIMMPILCVETGEIFPTSREAAISYGVLEQDIIDRLDRGKEVFPCGKTFSSF